MRVDSIGRVYFSPSDAGWSRRIRAKRESRRGLPAASNGVSNPQRGAVEKAYPSIAEWVKGCGWIEIGDQDWQGFVVRALDSGGLIFETEGCRSLGDALAALETNLAKWMKENL